MSLIPPAPGQAGSSTRPYLIRALHDWCTDNGFTPYLAVHVDSSVQVPLEYVKNHEIVLNVGFEATSGLKLGNELIEFRARFGGVSRDIAVPVDHVIAIYARENGQGMAFPVPAEPNPNAASSGAADVQRPAQPGGLRLASAEDGGVPAAVEDATAFSEDGSDTPEPPEPHGGGRPSLKRVK